jgi:K+-transporting ATPase A subunit
MTVHHLPHFHEHACDTAIDLDCNAARRVLADKTSNAFTRHRAVLTLLRYGSANDTMAAADYMARMFQRCEDRAIRQRWIKNFAYTATILAGVAIIAGAFL